MKSQPLNMTVNLTVKCMQLMIVNGITPRAVRMFLYLNSNKLNYIFKKTKFPQNTLEYKGKQCHCQCHSHCEIYATYIYDSKWHYT